MIELGGNITLNGFQDRDYAELIVVKKIVGRYARELSDRYAGFSALNITLSKGPDGETVTASCTVKGVQKDGQATEKNLFVALDAALKKVVQRLG